MSGYSNVVTGKLKLKGASPSTTKHKKDKRRKRNEDDDDGKRRESSDPSTSSSTHPDAHIPSKIPKPSSSEPLTSSSKPAPATGVQDTRTDAEKAFDKARQQREKELIKKMASKSHRQKVEEFNLYLANLSEHHDLPKVGPG